MKLVIFGATGRTGIPLIKQALENGHEITAFVRNPDKLPDDLTNRVTIVEGDILNFEDVDKAVQDQDAVASVIGQSKESPEDLQTRATEYIVSAMQAHDVNRIVSLTGAGVRIEKDTPKLFDKFMKVLLNIFAKKVLKDAEGHFEILKSSDLKWTVVRVPVLTEGELKGSYRVSYVGQDTGAKISRADVAHFILKTLENESYIHDAPMISY
jgi:putative NADH-flavin reductase